MHNTHGMGIVERVNRLVPPTTQLIVGESTSVFHQGFQVVAFEVFHNDAVSVAQIAIAVHLPNIGMFEFHHDESLVMEAFYNLLVVGQVLVQDLDGGSLSYFVFGIPHLGHTALT